jgi:hypothetical protein
MIPPSRNIKRSQVIYPASNIQFRSGFNQQDCGVMVAISRRPE